MGWKEPTSVNILTIFNSEKRSKLLLTIIFGLLICYDKILGITLLQHPKARDPLNMPHRGWLGGKPGLGYRKMQKVLCLLPPPLGMEAKEEETNLPPPALNNPMGERGRCEEKREAGCPRRHPTQKDRTPREGGSLAFLFRRRRDLLTPFRAKGRGKIHGHKKPRSIFICM